MELAEATYESNNGVAPYNVSLWDPDPNFTGSLGIQPTLRVPSSPFEYVFSYKISSTLKTAIAGKLGHLTSRAVLLTPSGTAANLVVLNLLKLLGRKRLWIVLPAYFQVPIAAKDVGLEIICSHALRKTDGWYLPEMPGLIPETDAVWITNPIYGVGDSIAASSVAALASYMVSGAMVIADECLCPVGAELARQLSHCSGFIGTYSPHKSVCMNGVKLGAVVADVSYIETLEYLSDVWAGPLTRMSIADAEHFLSENFDLMETAIRQKIAEAESALRRICSRFDCTLLGSTGPYRSVCVDGVSRDLEMSLDFVSQLINATGTSFIPAFVNLGSPDAPFSFRVNLTRRSVHMEAALFRLLQALRSGQ